MLLWWGVLRLSSLINETTKHGIKDEIQYLGLDVKRLYRPSELMFSNQIVTG